MTYLTRKELSAPPTRTGKNIDFLKEHLKPSPTAIFIAHGDDHLNDGYPKDVLSPCPVKHWPDYPTHALRVLDNREGEATPYTTLAFEFDGVMYHHENGEAVLQYVGDSIIKQWPLN